MLDEAEIICPYCGEILTLLVDTSAGDSSYIEDCHVCCQPMRIGLQVGPGGALTAVTADAEQA